MKLVQPSATLHPFNLGYKELLTIVANAVSLCYKVEKKDTIEGLEKFVKARIDSGHVSVIEHGNITVEFLTDRGVTHELVRHRLASYTQESTRYCNYSKGKFDNQLTFIIPEWMTKECDVNKITGRWVYGFDYGNFDTLNQKEVNVLSTGSFDGFIFYKMINGRRKDEVEVSQFILEYINDMLHTESMYMEFINKGMKPEDARGRLTNDLAANIIMTANIREWRHVLSLRSLGTTGRPHPNIKVIMDSLLEQLATTYPIFFADLLKSSTEMN